MLNDDPAPAPARKGTPWPVHGRRAARRTRNRVGCAFLVVLLGSFAAGLALFLALS